MINCMVADIIASLLQCISNLKEWCNNHGGRAEVIIVSFLQVVYTLKCPGSAYRSYLDNGLIRCLSKTPVNRCPSKIKHLNNS